MKDQARKKTRRSIPELLQGLKPTPEQRAQACEKEIGAILKRYDCRAVVAQPLVDGKVHLLTGIPLLVLFVPNEIGQAQPEAAPQQQPPGETLPPKG